MKFNPVTGELWTHSGKCIKTVHCPIGAKPHDLIKKESSSACRHCAGSVLRIDEIDDATVASFLASNGEQCVSLSLDNPNIEIVIGAPNE